MESLHSNFAEVFDRHVGRGKTLKVETVADVVGISTDTVVRIRSGASEAGVLLLHKLTRRFGAKHPELPIDLATVTYPGFHLQRNNDFHKTELDANGDGVVNRIDAMIHQADASEASMDKGKAILRGEHGDVAAQLDPQIELSSAKASACLRLSGG